MAVHSTSSRPMLVKFIRWIFTTPKRLHSSSSSSSSSTSSDSSSSSSSSPSSWLILIFYRYTGLQYIYQSISWNWVIGASVIVLLTAGEALNRQTKGLPDRYKTTALIHNFTKYMMNVSRISCRQMVQYVMTGGNNNNDNNNYEEYINDNDMSLMNESWTRNANNNKKRSVLQRVPHDYDLQPKIMHYGFCQCKSIQFQFKAPRVLHVWKAKKTTTTRRRRLSTSHHSALGSSSRRSSSSPRRSRSSSSNTFLRWVLGTMGSSSSGSAAARAKRRGGSSYHNEQDHHSAATSTAGGGTADGNSHYNNDDDDDDDDDDRLLDSYPRTRIYLSDFKLKSGHAQLRSYSNFRNDKSGVVGASTNHNSNNVGNKGSALTASAHTFCATCGMHVLYATKPDAKFLYVNICCLSKTKNSPGGSSRCSSVPSGYILGNIILEDVAVVDSVSSDGGAGRGRPFASAGGVDEFNITAPDPTLAVAFPGCVDEFNITAPDTWYAAGDRFRNRNSQSVGWQHQQQQPQHRAGGAAAPPTVRATPAQICSSQHRRPGTGAAPFVVSTVPQQQQRQPQRPPSPSVAPSIIHDFDQAMKQQQQQQQKSRSVDIHLVRHDGEDDVSEATMTQLGDGNASVHSASQTAGAAAQQPSLLLQQQRPDQQQQSRRQQQQQRSKPAPVVPPVIVGWSQQPQQPQQPGGSVSNSVGEGSLSSDAGKPLAAVPTPSEPLAAATAVWPVRGVHDEDDGDDPGLGIVLRQQVLSMSGTNATAGVNTARPNGAPVAVAANTTTGSTIPAPTVPMVPPVLNGVVATGGDGSMNNQRSPGGDTGAIHAHAAATIPLPAANANAATTRSQLHFYMSKHMKKSDTTTTMTTNSSIQPRRQQSQDQ